MVISIILGLPHVYYGGRILIDPTDADAWLRNDSRLTDSPRKRKNDEVDMMMTEAA